MDSQLTIFFSGTQMVWEDLTDFLELGAKNRHNLSNSIEKTSNKHLYYMFDGPAATVSDQHTPVEHLKFDKYVKDFVKGKRRRAANSLGLWYRFIFGSGTNHISQTAYELVENQILERGIRNIDLIGFSRGGNIALNVGVLIKELETTLYGKLTQDQIESIQFRIFAIDPVPGISTNIRTKHRGEMSRLVKSCVIGLATNESLAGFHPRDNLSLKSKYHIKFNPETKYIFLPFPDDHFMCIKWMRDLIKSQLPSNSELLLPCDKAMLIKRRLGMESVTWIDKVDETCAYRMIYDAAHTGKYNRDILPKNVDQTIDQKRGVEEFFKYLSTQYIESNIGHTSLQNDADSESSNRYFDGRPVGGLFRLTEAAQRFCAKASHHRFFAHLGFSDRNCKQKLDQYTNPLFVNLLHEAMFKIAYPNIYVYLLNRRGLDRCDALREFNNLSKDTYPWTKSYLEKWLNINLKLTPITALKSTNVSRLDEVYRLCVEDGISQPQQTTPRQAI